MKEKNKRRVKVAISSVVIIGLPFLVIWVLEMLNVDLAPIKNMMEDARVDFFTCQISSALLIMSIVSILNEKGKKVYWTDTMKFKYKWPVLKGIRAISVYLAILALASFLSFLFSCDLLLLAYFGISIFLLIVIIHSLIIVYYGKDRVLCQLEKNYNKMDVFDKTRCIKDLISNTYKAYDDRDSDIFIENCSFLLERLRENDKNESEKELECVYKDAFEGKISRYAFWDYRKEWEPFYYDVLKELHEKGVDYYKTDNYSYLPSFINDNWLKLTQIGAIESKVFSDDSIDSNKNISFFGEKTKELFENADNNREDIRFMGEAIWNNPGIIDIYFGETLFMDYSFKGRKCVLRTKVIKELNDNRDYYGESCVLGYLYSVESIIINLNNKIEDTIKANIEDDGVIYSLKDFEMINEKILKKLFDFFYETDTCMQCGEQYPQIDMDEYYNKMKNKYDSVNHDEEYYEAIPNCAWSLNEFKEKKLTIVYDNQTI